MLTNSQPKLIATILFDCPIGRYKSGERGEVLPNDFPKYQYKIQLPPAPITNHEGLLACINSIPRIIYFYAGEVKILAE